MGEAAEAVPGLAALRQLRQGTEALPQAGRARSQRRLFLVASGRALQGEGLTMAKRAAPTGLCFPYAKTAMQKFGDDAEVIHARIKMPDGRRGAHAWIEHNGRVYDWQNTDQRGETIPIKTYYAVAKPTSIKRYTPEEVLKNCTRQRHDGPWEKSWRGGRAQGWTFKGTGQKCPQR